MKNIEFYVKGLFRNIERTPEINEQIEELSSHISERVQDLINKGMSEEKALEKIILDLGDLDELIDTMSGKKVHLLIHKLNMQTTGAGFVYGLIYLFFVTIGLWKGSMGKSSLFLTIPALTGYFIPFVFALIRFILYPQKKLLLAMPLIRAIHSSLLGWFFISFICVVANVLMIVSVPGSTFWSWMPVAGVLTWPLMETVFYILAKKEVKRS